MRISAIVDLDRRWYIKYIDFITGFRHGIYVFICMSMGKIEYKIPKTFV